MNKAEKVSFLYTEVSKRPFLKDIKISRKPSSIFKHLEAEVKCRDSCDESCFEIIDTDTSSFRLEIKEAIHNEWVKPKINKQKNLLKLSILI